ncbi:MAG: cysteine desulfurase [Neomegalonema sp.]|nr:cysteine desulfurase [Neomegalonema sp.]
MTYDVEKIRADFPILSREVNGKKLVYLDSAASAQKPKAVIDAVAQSYSAEYANVHRGLHFLSNLATDHYEAVRGKLQRFLGARSEAEIIFTSGTTEAINLVASSWGAPQIGEGDEIILSVMEHHANIVPWHFLRERLGAKLVWVEPDPNGDLAPETVAAAITDRTKLIAITHMSNVLGTVVDVKRVTEIAHAAGVAVLVDGSQAAVHMPVNVADLGCDFYAVTGHKLYGPTGCGALYVRQERFDEMRPYQGGGDMIREVTRDVVTYADPPLKFEAGTPAITQIIGLGAALDYLSELGMENVAAHEQAIRDYANAQLSGLNWLTVHGRSATKGAIFSLAMEGAHPHDISTIIDARGIAVRAGHHCAQPLMQHLGVTATARASCALYTTEAEIDALVAGLERCRAMFG